jgi:hypothetical protein
MPDVDIEWELQIVVINQAIDISFKPDPSSQKVTFSGEKANLTA